MSSFPALPDKIFNIIKDKISPKDSISAFLAPPESISRYERSNVWIILTKNTIIFCIYEENSEPAIDTLDLVNLQEVEYIERIQNTINLDFVPKTGKSFKITYSSKRQDDINNFCEKIADYITYKQEKAYGIETLVISKYKTIKSAPLETPKISKPDKTETNKDSVEERKIKIAKQNLLLKDILTDSLKRNQDTQVSVLKPIKKLKDSDYTSLPHTVSSIGKDRSSLLPAAISGDKVEVKTVGTPQFNDIRDDIIKAPAEEAKKEEITQPVPTYSPVSGIPALRKSVVKNKATTQEKEPKTEHPIPVLYYSPTSSKAGAIPKYNEEEPEILPELLKKPADNNSNKKTEVSVSNTNINYETKPVIKNSTSNIITNKIKTETIIESPQKEKTTELTTKPDIENKISEEPINKSDSISESNQNIAPRKTNNSITITPNTEETVASTVNKEIAPNNLNDNLTNNEPKEIVLMESGNAPVSVLVTATVAAASAYVWYKLFKFVQKNF